MNYYIVIPAHNEDKYISLTLDSIVSQTVLPKKVIVVNDNSTDNTSIIIENYTSKYSYIKQTTSLSNNTLLPGCKVINAFYKGYELLDDDYDIIVGAMPGTLAFNVLRSLILAGKPIVDISFFEEDPRLLHRV